MLPDEKIKCHRTGFQKTCYECVTESKCQLWMHLQMIHPQTGIQLDKWGCKDSLELILTVDLGKKLNEVSAGVDKVANQQVQIAAAQAVDNAQKIANEVMRVIPVHNHSQRLLDAKD